MMTKNKTAAKKTEDQSVIYKVPAAFALMILVIYAFWKLGGYYSTVKGFKTLYPMFCVQRYVFLALTAAELVLCVLLKNGLARTICRYWLAAFALLSWLATRRLRDVPGPLQNAAEMAVEKLQGFYGGILGPANARRYFPMMATFFIFIVVSNYIGLLPGAGQVFTVPTATLSVTAGLAIIAFCMTHTVGIQRRGLGGYLKSFIKPFLLMLPLNLIEQIVRPFSLALRLYGNLYGEEMVTHELGNLFPLVLPLLMQVLSLLFCLIQAVVFTMLLSIYIEEAIEE